MVEKVIRKVKCETYKSTVGILPVCQQEIDEESEDADYKLRLIHRSVVETFADVCREYNIPVSRVTYDGYTVTVYHPQPLSKRATDLCRVLLIGIRQFY